jgi:glycosyltransferase involved in cell wall biosynthesis
MHILVYTLVDQHYVTEQISDRVWIHPTNSVFKWAYPFSALRIFKKELSDFKPHVITTQDPFETGLAGFLISKRVHTKLHIQIHTDFLSRYFTYNSVLNYIRVIIAKWLLPKAHAVRAVSLRIKKSLARIDPSLPARTSVLPIYSDISVFKQVQTAVDLHKKYPHFSRIILMASRFTQEKNIGLALSLLRDVVGKYQNVGLLIVGEGPEKHYLEGLVLRYHLDRNVVFEPWQQNIHAYFASADIFLTTSLYEGYGLTLLEAAVSGCPIISSDVGIATTIIEQGVNGFVCDITDQSSFTHALTLLLEKPEAYDAVKKNAQKYAAEKIAESKDQYMETYKTMLEEAVMAR